LFETKSRSFPSPVCRLEHDRKDLGEREEEERKREEEEGEEARGGRGRPRKEVRSVWSRSAHICLLRPEALYQTMWKDQASENTQKRPRLARGRGEEGRKRGRKRRKRRKCGRARETQDRGNERQWRGNSGSTQ
jgi:hypothetical protein